MENFLRQQKPYLIGFLQAAGVILYCTLIAGFFTLIDKFAARAGFIGIALMLSLFVFSAAITGSLVFGYPVYLALNKKIKEALDVLAYTLVYSLMAILIILIIMLVIPVLS